MTAKQNLQRASSEIDTDFLYDFTCRSYFGGLCVDRLARKVYSETPLSDKRRAYHASRIYTDIHGILGDIRRGPRFEGMPEVPVPSWKLCTTTYKHIHHSEAVLLLSDKLIIKIQICLSSMMRGAFNYARERNDCNRGELASRMERVVFYIKTLLTLLETGECPLSMESNPFDISHPNSPSTAA